MSHSLILGMTESGKTTLAKQLVQQYKLQGVATVVLDPLCDPAWNADFQTSAPDEFLRVVWQSKQCAVFIDESGDMVGKYNDIMERTATRGRHWGHRMHYLSQRATQLSRTVRDQCSHLFLFCSSLEDGKVHANDWNKPQLAECHTLKKGEYFYCSRFSDIQKLKLF